MAQGNNDQGSKDKIEEGMSEAGKGQGTGGDPGKGQSGYGADPGKLTEGMSEAGSSTPTGGEGSGTSGKR